MIEAKTRKIQNLNRTTTKNQVGSSIADVRTTAIDMAIIQIQIEKNTIEDVLLAGDYRINIIT